MKKKIIPLFVVSALALMMTACEHTAPAPSAEQNSESNFVPLDSGVQNSITCTGIQTRTLPDGRLEVAANIRNRENRRLQVQINCAFKDEQGFEVDATPFDNLFLDENATETRRWTSANNQAKKFTIHVREAR